MGVVGYTRLAVVGMFGLGVVVSQVDLAMNYEEIDAKVTSVSYDCYVESSKRKLVEKPSKNLAFMDCETAKYAAKEFGYSEKDIHKRAKLKFSWVSPVDGSKHNSEREVMHTADGQYKVGGKVKIYAHTEDPEKMRWL